MWLYEYGVSVMNAWSYECMGVWVCVWICERMSALVYARHWVPALLPPGIWAAIFDRRRTMDIRRHGFSRRHGLQEAEGKGRAATNWRDNVRYKDKCAQ